MASENRIVKVELTLVEGHGKWLGPNHWIVSVTKEFAPEYGGGSQTFQEDGGTHVHHALDVARGMVTLSPGARTDQRQA